MACYNPLTGFRNREGRVVFDEFGSHAANRVSVPCGQCIGCRVAKSREWALRCVHEASLHEHNCFITLTYDDKFLPFDGSLNVRDWQLFAKKVRNRIGPFKFFMCGEYGDKTFRPHYHACIFGLDCTDKVKYKERSDGRISTGSQSWNVYTSAGLDELWGKGFTTVGSLTWASAAYVARYAMKKVTGARSEEHYAGRKPEFVNMSRGGRTGKGIGHGWFEKYKDDVFPEDEVIHQGRRFRPPRYYETLLDKEELEAIQRERRRKVNLKDNTPERLAVRETVAKASLNLLKRESV